MLEGKGASAVCEAFHICHSCVTVPECEWSIDPKMAKCQKMKDRKHLQTHLQSAVIPITKKIGGSSKNGLNRDSGNDRKQNRTMDMKDSRNFLKRFAHVLKDHLENQFGFTKTLLSVKIQFQ